MNSLRIAHCSARQWYFRALCAPMNVRLKSTTTTETKSNFKTVYVGDLIRQVRLIKGFSLGTSCVALALQPTLFSKCLLKEPGILGYFLGAGCFFFMMVTPVLLHYLTKRYVTHLRYHPITQQFEADTITFFLKTRTTSFVADDVKIPEISGPLTSLYVKGKPLLIQFENITNADAYEYLLKFDQPLDLKIDMKKDKDST